MLFTIACVVPTADKIHLSPCFSFQPIIQPRTQSYLTSPLNRECGKFFTRKIAMNVKSKMTFRNGTWYGVRNDLRNEKKIKKTLRYIKPEYIYGHRSCVLDARNQLIIISYYLICDRNRE